MMNGKAACEAVGPSSGGGTAYGRYPINWGQKLLPRARQQRGKKTKWTYEQARSVTKRSGGLAALDAR